MRTAIYTVELTSIGYSSVVGFSGDSIAECARDISFTFWIDTIASITQAWAQFVIVAPTVDLFLLNWLA